MKVFMRAAMIACMALMLASTLWWFVLLWLCVNAPLAPIAANGQVIPFNNHGTLHYVTTFQDFCLHWQVFLSMPFALLARWLSKRYPWPWFERVSFGKRSA